MVPRAAALLFPGVPEGLSGLKAAGLTLGVATSKHHASARAILTYAGLWDFFDAVAGADSVQAPKPDPEMVLYVADRLRVDPRDCIMIGDTEHDLKMGRAAGMRTAAVTHGVGTRQALAAAHPNLIADDFAALTSAILAAQPRHAA